MSANIRRTPLRLRVTRIRYPILRYFTVEPNVQFPPYYPWASAAHCAADPPLAYPGTNSSGFWSSVIGYLGADVDFEAYINFDAKTYDGGSEVGKEARREAERGLEASKELKSEEGSGRDSDGSGEFEYHWAAWMAS